MKVFKIYFCIILGCGIIGAIIEKSIISGIVFAIWLALCTIWLTVLVWGFVEGIKRLKK